MGRNHALIAGTCGAAVAGALGIRSPETLGLLAVVVAGSGLLPDLDHPSASPGRAFLMVGQTVAAVEGSLAGGHRKATHSAAAAAIVGALTFGVWHFVEPMAIVVGVLVTMAVWTILPPAIGSRSLRHILAWGAGAGIGYWWMSHPLSLVVTVAAITGGYVAHLVCDTLTVGGVMWLWPWHYRTSVPLCGCTGSTREEMFALVVSTGAIILTVIGH